MMVDAAGRGGREHCLRRFCRSLFFYTERSRLCDTSQHSCSPLVSSPVPPRCGPPPTAKTDAMSSTILLSISAKSRRTPAKISATTPRIPARIRLETRTETASGTATARTAGRSVGTSATRLKINARIRPISVRISASNRTTSAKIRQMSGKTTVKNAATTERCCARLRYRR